MAKAKIIAGRLLRKNRGTRKIQARSWRAIVREDYPGGIIKPGTLSRFATSRGTWIPAREEIQIALGLKHAKKQKTHRAPTPLIDMCMDELCKAFINRETMPEPTYNKRVMDAFIRECKRSSALRRATS
jgi:hypothetical protein